MERVKPRKRVSFANEEDLVKVHYFEPDEGDAGSHQCT